MKTICRFHRFRSIFTRNPKQRNGALVSGGGVVSMRCASLDLYRFAIKSGCDAIDGTPQFDLDILTSADPKKNRHSTSDYVLLLFVSLHFCDGRAGINCRVRPWERHLQHYTEISTSTHDTHKRDSVMRTPKPDRFEGFVRVMCAADDATEVAAEWAKMP